MYSANEWDPLRKVVVGIADHAKIPELSKSLRTVNYSDVAVEDDIPKAGLYPQQVIDEANEDLEILTNELQKLGVKVVRPKNIPTPYYNYCPRDLVTIVKDKAIIAPMSLQCRHSEYKNLQDHLTYQIIIPNNLSDENYNVNSVGNKDILALNELQPKFDAANIIRANNDLLYLVSNSGNKKGAECVQALFGNEIRVHTVEKIYSYMHIDSTIAFLREGLMLLNPARINDKNLLPAPFNKWDAIFAPEPFDIGHYPGYCNASKWINVNLLSVNPDLVIIEEHQTNLAKELKKHKIDSLMLPMRHARTLGGCFHCVTLDLVRG